MSAGNGTPSNVKSDPDALNPEVTAISAQAASPNAGWPEAAMAGALGVRLGGPSIYFDRLVEKPFIGEAGQPLDRKRYRQAVRLLYGTSLVMAALTLIGLQVSQAGVWGLLSLVR